MAAVKRPKGRPKKAETKPLQSRSVIRRENIQQGKPMDEGIGDPSIDVQAQTDALAVRALRQREWDALDEYTKERLGMTEEEFLAAEDVTGFGKNSTFTPLADRSVTVTKSLPDIKAT